MAERGVLVERHLPIQGQDLTFGCLNQWVHLDESCILVDKHIPQPFQNFDHLITNRGVKGSRINDFFSLGAIDSDQRVDIHASQRLWTLNSELLNLNATLFAGHCQEGSV